MRNYAYLLHSHELKATPQRLTILEIIDMAGHINIDELYKKVKEKFYSISLATIYKNLNILTKNLLLTKVKLPNEKSVYEITKHEHSHLLCKSCGEVIDIDLATDNIKNKVTKEYGFTIDQSNFIVTGICKKCK